MPIIIRSKEEFEHYVITKHAEGASIRGLSRDFKVSRNTIRKLLRDHNKKRDKGHNVLAPLKKRKSRNSKLDSFRPQIENLLKEFPDITGQRLFEELRDEGFTGGITIVRDLLIKLRPRPKRAPIVRFETEPGQQGQVDWSLYTINFARTGKLKVQCFSYILGFSRKHFIHFNLRKDFYTLIRRHQDAFHYFGGVPLECLYDNEKTVCLRWKAGSPVFNPAFIAFITHYNCRPVACRPRRPETKGKVEAPFQYVEKNLLNARVFQDLEDLNVKTKWWLREKSDFHIHNTTRAPPQQLFLEQEQQALQPLPPHPYDCAEVLLRVCRFDGFIDHESNIYSVPYEYGGLILAMKVMEYEIFIYSPELALIAHHERLSPGKGGKIEKSEHRGSTKVRYGLEPVRDTFLALGNAAGSFLKGIKEKHPGNCGFHARYILCMKEKYRSEDINNALYHAIRYHAFDGKAIERILRAKARPRTLESMRNEQARKQLEKTLPTIKQRPLDEYMTLF